MGAVIKCIEKTFDEIAKALEVIANELVESLKLAANSFVGVFKQLYQATIALAQAIADGDFEEMAKQLLELAQTMATLVQPELLAMSIAEQVAMKWIQDTISLAAEALGMKNQPWMKDVLGAMDVASNFTSLGDAAMALGTELASNVLGEKGPLQSTWESHHPEEQEDENYKRIYEESLAYKEKNSSEKTDTTDTESSYAI